MELCDQRALASLRWHWSGAYLICHPGLHVWVAQRRDTRETLRAGSSEALREAILADYFSHPVPRRLRGS
jgi:hypothetical protein